MLGLTPDPLSAGVGMPSRVRTATNGSPRGRTVQTRNGRIPPGVPFRLAAHACRTAPSPACRKRPFTTHADRLRPRLKGGRLPVAGPAARRAAGRGRRRRQRLPRLRVWRTRRPPGTRQRRARAPDVPRAIPPNLPWWGTQWKRGFCGWNTTRSSIQGQPRQRQTSRSASLRGEALRRNGPSTTWRYTPTTCSCIWPRRSRSWTL